MSGSRSVQLRTRLEPSTSTGSTAEALPKAAPMRLKVGPSESDIRDKSEIERPALQILSHLGHICEEIRVRPELLGPLHALSASMSLKVDLM